MLYALCVARDLLWALKFRPNGRPKWLEGPLQKVYRQVGAARGTLFFKEKPSVLFVYYFSLLTPKLENTFTGMTCDLNGFSNILLIL